jgi:hypothetical protein
MESLEREWGDGSGDKLYVDYSGVAGTAEESVISSDVNLTGVSRSIVLTYVNNGLEVEQTVTQRARPVWRDELVWDDERFWKE